MKQIPLANSLLWLVNACVAAVVVVFAVQNLVFAEAVNHLANVVEDGALARGPRKQEPKDYSVLRNLGNPVVPRGDGRTGGDDGTLNARFLCRFGIEGREPAFLFLPGSNSYVNAYRGEPVTQVGAIVPELRGWVLKDFTADGALFTNGTRDVELRRDSGVAAYVPPGPARWKGGVLQSADGYELRGVDPAEANWALANVDQALAGVTLSSYPSGGVRIDAAGDLGARHGFFDGDVIKSVNGVPIGSPVDLRRLVDDPRHRGLRKVMINVERAGKMFTLEFQPQP